MVAASVRTESQFLRTGQGRDDERDTEQGDAGFMALRGYRAGSRALRNLTLAWFIKHSDVSDLCQIRCA